MQTDLSLPQAMLLLSLDTETGKTEGNFRRLAIAGATLAELLLLETIELRCDEGLQVLPRRHYQTLGAFLKKCDAEIGREKTVHSLQDWLIRLTQLEGFIPLLGDELCERGVLSKERAARLNLLKRTAWPTVSDRLEQHLITELSEVLFEQKHPTEPQRLLIALSKSAGVLHHNFPVESLNANGHHIETLVAVQSPDLSPLMQVAKVVRDVIIGASPMGRLTGSLLT